MLGKYYVVTLNTGSRSPPNDAIERALAQPLDWLRFSPDCYYVYAYGLAAVNLYHLLKPLLHAEDLILVTELSAAERYGWVSQVAIDWFNRPRL